MTPFNYTRWKRQQKAEAKRSLDQAGRIYGEVELSLEQHNDLTEALNLRDQYEELRADLMPETYTLPPTSGSFIMAVDEEAQKRIQQAKKDTFNWLFDESTGMGKTKIYLVGSLRNDKIPAIAETLRSLGYEVFDDWYAAGPEADDYWQKYEKGRGHTFAEAIQGFAAGHVFEFDRHHLDTTDVVVLILPAGKSGHLELGYAAGKGKTTYIVYEDEPERFDVMYRFATKTMVGIDQLIEELQRGENEND